MTLNELHNWHKEQAERFKRNSVEHKTMGSKVHRDAVGRHYAKLAEFHKQAAELIHAAIWN